MASSQQDGNAVSGNDNNKQKISVLFCCLGNICRSTMAEGVFQSLARSNPRVGTIDSCGTGAYHSLDPPDPRTMDTLARHGITDYDHGARQVTLDDFARFDYIFAMDRWNLRDLQKLQRRAETRKSQANSSSKAKVMLFGEFAGNRGRGQGESSDGAAAEEVVDPYYGADDGFDTVYEQVKRFSTNFLRDVVDVDVDIDQGGDANSS